jgi:8-oxo-dGTP diphosphatase
MRYLARRGSYLVGQALFLSQASGLAMKMSTTATTPSFIDKLALILVRDRLQLVVRSHGKTAFFTPGGKREAGESDEVALCRECKEELTIDLVPSTIRPYGVFQAQAFGKPEGTMVRMTCYQANFKGTLTASEEIEELRWVSSDCPRELLTVTGIMILEDLKQNNLID